MKQEDFNPYTSPKGEQYDCVTCWHWRRLNSKLAYIGAAYVLAWLLFLLLFPEVNPIYMRDPSPFFKSATTLGSLLAILAIHSLASGGWHLLMLIFSIPVALAQYRILCL